MTLKNMGFPDAFEMVDLDSKDTPHDCHRHCLCWDAGDACCDCGDTHGPEEAYITEFQGQVFGILQAEERTSLQPLERLTNDIQ